MLVGLENITNKKTNEPQTMHTFIDKNCAVIKGYRPGHNVKDYADKLKQPEGELAWDESKSYLFPFKMNEWEGVTTYRLQGLDQSKK